MAKKHKLRYKKDFTETVVHDDMKRKMEVEKNYHMEYIPSKKPGQTGQWLYIIKNPETGEVLEKRTSVGGNWRCVYRKDDDE